jgi:hypothetical protein
MTQRPDQAPRPQFSSHNPQRSRPAYPGLAPPNERRQWQERWEPRPHFQHPAPQTAPAAQGRYSSRGWEPAQYFATSTTMPRHDRGRPTSQDTDRSFGQAGRSAPIQVQLCTAHQTQAAQHKRPPGRPANPTIACLRMPAAPPNPSQSTARPARTRESGDRRTPDRKICILTPPSHSTPMEHQETTSRERTTDRVERPRPTRGTPYPSPTGPALIGNQNGPTNRPFPQETKSVWSPKENHRDCLSTTRLPTRQTRRRKAEWRLVRRSAPRKDARESKRTPAKPKNGTEGAERGNAHNPAPPACAGQAACIPARATSQTSPGNASAARKAREAASAERPNPRNGRKGRRPRGMAPAEATQGPKC